jgi:hypothetical protein
VHKHNALKVCRGRGGKVPYIVELRKDGGQRSASRFVRFIPGKDFPAPIE